MEMIDFNRSPVLGTELEYFQEALQSARLCGDGPFTKKVSEWFRNRFDVRHVYMTTSCTSALEMASWLCDLEPGDEVIMPSYTSYPLRMHLSCAGLRSYSWISIRRL